MNSLKKQLSDFFDHQFESEIALQELSLEREKALKLSRDRDMFHFGAMCSITTVLFLTFLAVKTKNKAFAAPCPFLVFGAGYYYEKLFNHGIKLKSGAKDILNNEPHFVKPVGGTLTLYEIDRRIKRAKEIKN